MKRKSLRTLVCALLASLALTTFAFADNGPKPQLIVRVKNAPQEPYYLDLLAKGDWDAEDGNRIDGSDWLTTIKSLRNFRHRFVFIVNTATAQYQCCCG